MPISTPLLATAGVRGVYLEHLRAHGGPVIGWQVGDSVTAFLDTERTGWNAIQPVWISTPLGVDCGLLGDVHRAITGGPQDAWWVVHELFASYVSTQDVIAHPGLILHASGWEQKSSTVIAEAPQQEAPLPPAIRLRELTGLGAGRLAELFGVSRVAYQGWIGGVQPTLTREEHLLQVLALADEANKRLGSATAVRHWMLAPVSPGGPSPLDLLRDRRYDTVRGFLLRARTGTETVKRSLGRSRGPGSVSERHQRETVETLNAST